MARFHERYDLLLTPTLATPAFAVSHDVPPDGSFGDDWIGWTPYSYPFNLTLQPAATVPCGLTAGRPPGRSADRRPDAPRRPRAARLARLRGDPALADDRGAAGAHRIVRRVTGALYAEYRSGPPGAARQSAFGRPYMLLNRRSILAAAPAAAAASVFGAPAFAQGTPAAAPPATGPQQAPGLLPLQGRRHRSDGDQRRRSGCARSPTASSGTPRSTR